MDENNCYLLIVLKPELTLSLWLGDVDDYTSLVVADIEFKEVAGGSFNGFYDWLRDSEGRVLGVRYYPFEDYCFLFSVVTELDFVEVVESDTCFNIYFSGDSELDESKSCDQAFGGNKIFKSAGGEYFISFDATEVKDTLIRTQ